MIDKARQSHYKDDFEVRMDGNIYAFDSSAIYLCLSVFWWTKFRKHKGGIKLHTLYDLKISILTFVLITSAKVNDMNEMDCLYYESGSFYIFDRGYVDFDGLYRINESEVWFCHTCQKEF